MTSEPTLSLSDYHRLPQTQPGDFYRRQLEVICNNATLALFIMDARQECVYMNPAAELLTGYSLAETQGRTLHDVIHHTRPDGRPYPLCECPIDRALPQNNQEQGEEVFVHKDGHFYPVAYTASPIREGDRVTGTIIEVRDITQEKLAEQERQAAAQREQVLRQEAEVARQRVETILSSINDGVFVLDYHWCYTYVNDRLCQMVGKSREELLNHNTWQLFPKAVGTEVERQFRRALREQVQVQFEYLYLPWNRWFEYRVYPSEQGITVFSSEITDRKQTAAALRESTAILNMLNQATPNLIYVKDRQGRLLLANPATVRLIGQSEADILGKTVLEFLAPAEAEPIVENDRYVLETGSAQVFEEIVAAPEGTRIFLSTKAPYRDEQGTIIGLIGVSVDITNRKRAEEAVQESERRLRRLVESNMFGVAFGNFAGQIYSVNDYFVNMVGYSREEITTGQVRWIDITPPEFLHLDEQAAEELKTRGVATPFEKEYIRKDGTRVPLLIGAALLDEPYHQQQDIVAFYLDLTQRKQSEQALQQALQKLNFHVENTPMAVIEWDGSMRILRWSGAAERLFGWQADEVLGQLLPELHLVFEADVEAVETVARRLMSGTESYVFSYNRNYTKSGEVIHCEWYNSSLWDEAGQVISVLSLVLDVTDQKRAEAEREQLLAREQAARAAAEQANRIKDEFLAVVSHELRTPLNPILGWSKLLQTRQLEPAKTAQALETIARNASLQAELIEDLLDISRILRGKLSLDVGPVNLRSTVQAALETVRLSAEAKSIQIHTDLDSSSGLVLGDASRLQQIAWNLLSNAIKFTPSAGQVTVRLEGQSDMAQITVSDTGKGISPNFLPHVFDYFRQEDSATTRKFGGLGLGLAIVHHLVELHGGTVTAESPGEGLGATFIVRLPLVQNPDEDIESNSLEDIADLAGLRVLVVDDDADTRNFVAFLLEQAGATVITAPSAGDALITLSRFHPDVLISDIGMPEMDGYSLLRQVRSLPVEQGSQIPAIALTAYAGEIDYQQAMAVGFQRHLAKPIAPERLVRAIADLVQRSVG